MANYIKSLRDGVLTLRDGSGTPVTHEVVFAEGDLTWKETQQQVELRNRGVLYDVKVGDEAPIEWSASLKVHGLEAIPLAETVLSGDAGASDTTLNCTAPVSLGFTAPGVAVLRSTTLPTKAEVVTYTGVSTGVLTGVTRGTAGTTGKFWLTGDRLVQIESGAGQVWSFLHHRNEFGGLVSTRATTQVITSDLVFQAKGVDGLVEETIDLEDAYLTGFDFKEGADYNTITITGKAWRVAPVVS